MLQASLDIPADKASMEAALEGLTRLNQVLLREAKRRGRPFPSLYRSGVRYNVKDGFAAWRTIPQIFRTKTGICSGLAAWRAAELRESGHPARVIVRPSLSGIAGRWHAMVRCDTGIEDPSARLGMPIDVARAKRVNRRYL